MLSGVGGELHVVLGLVTEDVEEARGGSGRGLRVSWRNEAASGTSPAASLEQDQELCVDGVIVRGVTGRLDWPEHLILGRYSSETGT